MIKNINLFYLFLIDHLEISILIALLLPALVSFLIITWASSLKYIYVNILTLIAQGVSLFLAIFSMFYIYKNSCIIYIDFAEEFNYYWLSSYWIDLTYIFLFDQITGILFIVVLLVSFAVNIYSIAYMSEEPRRNIFFGFLNLFTFFMLFFVSSGNFIQLFLGWEGVGLCSYLLINFWFMRIEANKAGIKAVVVNKVGDCAFMLALSFIYKLFKTFDLLIINQIIWVNYTNYVPIWYKDGLLLRWGEPGQWNTDKKFQMSDNLPYYYGYGGENYYNWFELFGGYSIDIVFLIALFLLIAAMGKSAQIGLHTWLPDAMEGPTPVSALIHAATMVTAGIFLIIRCGKIFEIAPAVSYIMIIVGTLTAFFAASVALAQNDIKKIIAYSTCSQLGYMFIACGFSHYGLALFHLTTHAFFKALLFLSAGALLHSMNDEQDIRRMGALGGFSQITYIFFWIGSLSLTGFPFFSGFYSKDLIINSTLILYDWHEIFSTINNFAYTLSVITAILTILYSFKLIYKTFTMRLRIKNLKFSTLHKTNNLTVISLSLLAFFAITAGFFLKNYFLNFNNNNFDTAKQYNEDFSFPIGTWLIFFFNFLFFLPPIKYFFFSFLSPFLKKIFFKKRPTFTKITNKNFVLNFIQNFFYFIIFLYKGIIFIICKIITKIFFFFYDILKNKWYFDDVYNFFIAQNLFKLSSYLNKYVEKGILETFGPKGIGFLLRKIGSFLSFYQAHNIHGNVLQILLFFTFLFFCLLL